MQDMMSPLDARAKPQGKAAAVAVRARRVPVALRLTSQS